MATLTIDAEIVREALDNAGLDYSAFRFDYSGRGMYGDNCIGLVGSDGDAIKFCAYLAKALDAAEVLDFDSAIEDLANARSDSMGLSGITYWPHMAVDSWEGEDDA